MADHEWQEFKLYGRPLRVRRDTDGWHVGIDDREVSAPHLDQAVEKLLDVPSHMAVKLSLAILNAAAGSEIA